MQKVKLIRVSLKQVETLYIIRSPDIIGLHASARSAEEALAKAPGAIKEMLDFVGGNWAVEEIENPEAIGAEFAFAAIPMGTITIPKS